MADLSPVREAVAAPGVRRRPRFDPALLILPALLLLLLTYVLPVGGLLWISFGSTTPTLAFYREVLGDWQLWEILGETLLVAALVTVICAALAYPVAFMTLRSSRRMQWIILILLTLPMWTSVLVRTYSWLVLLGRSGPINALLLGVGVIDAPVQFLYSRGAVVIGMVHVLLPFAIFPLFAVMRRLDDKLVVAAETLGARRWASILLVFFPLTWPGLASGAIIVFLHAIGYFVPPGILGGLKETTYVMLIEHQVNGVVAWEKAAAMAVVLLAVTAAIVVTFGRYLGVLSGNEGGSAPAASRSTAAVTRLAASFIGRLKMGSGRRLERQRRRRPVSLFTTVISWSVIAFLLAPVLLLVPLSLSGASFLEFPPSSLSLRWYENFFGRRDWMASLATSAEVALLTTIAATILGGAAAIGIERSRVKGVNFSFALLVSPAIVPTLIVAVGVYFQFVRLKLVGTTIGLVLAHLIITLPVVLLITLGGLRNVDTAPERAARSLGAGPIRAFFATTFPMVRPSVIAAALFAFLASFDDVTMALFMSGVTAETLPKRMWESIRFEIDPTLSAISTVLMGISIFLLAVSEIVRKREKH